MSLSLFISHSFEHPDKMLRIQEFIHERGVRHVDYSIPSWEPFQGPDVQGEIERRIRRCDRVLVILTKGIHKSKWITQEVEWARKYDKPVIGIWPHGEAGSPIPEVVADTIPALIGWRATSLEKALRLQDVGEHRALDIAEEADRKRLITRVATASGAVSLLLVGYELHQFVQLRKQLRAKGFGVDPSLDGRQLVADLTLGALVGALVGLVGSQLVGADKELQSTLTLVGGAIGGAWNVHRRLRAELATLGPLTALQITPVEK